MRQIAIYGKGGIGKSVIAANLSAALALAGRKVLQIGCDPKHDSTRLLTRGTATPTVLDYLKAVPPDQWRLGDVVATGFQGISCVEAGGPEPGVGCAGRGILTTFDLLEKLGLDRLNLDLVIYDVLGDVVCGGFAVPLRRQYADAVYIVTSGEFMSIYAANNILRGLKNYDGNIKRAAGLILNRRGIEDEDGRIERFARAVGLPVLEAFPRSEEFSRAEELGMTMVESHAASPVAGKFRSLAARIIRGGALFQACPLTDVELEQVVLDRGVGDSLPQPAFAGKSAGAAAAREDAGSGDPEDTGGGSPAGPDPGRRFLSKNVLLHEPLHGCAFNGAVNVTAQIAGAFTLAHGPRSCAHIAYQTITSAGRRLLFERGVLAPAQIAPPLASSDMNEGVMIFGGLGELREKIAALKASSPGAIFVVTTCPAGIIGDDTDSLRDLDGRDGVRVIPIKTDGDISGDYLQGVITSYIEVARALIRRGVQPEGDLVNIVAEKAIATNTASNFEVVRGLLGALGIGVNCRFIGHTSLQEIANFGRAKVNLLTYEDYMGRTIRDFLQEEYGAPFLKRPFPVGCYETEQWLYEVAACFGKQEQAPAVVAEQKKIYSAGVAKLRPLLEHRRLMIIAFSHDLDWIIETAFDLGMEIAKVCILDYSQDNLFRTRFGGRFPLELHYDPARRTGDLELLQPDLLLSSYAPATADGHTCTDIIPLCPDTGFLSGLALAGRWAGILKRKMNEGWKRDGALFTRYYA
jgi:nitrogenase iron protein NifH